jgi:ribosome-associated toxin RatA of RatAB toxin-antitoxin module
MRQTMTLAIVALEPDCLIADEQVSGPFRRLHQERRLEPTAAGVRLHVHIDFEPPGGIVGLLLTPHRIQEYLAEMHEYSVRAMRTLLTPAGGG